MNPTTFIRHLLFVLLCGACLSTGWAQGFPFGPKKLKRPDTLLIIHAGQLLAVPGEASLAEHTVIVRKDKIAEIRPGYVSADAIDSNEAKIEVLDLRQYFVMPGLMDAHVHLARATGSYQGSFASVSSTPAIGAATVNALINAQLNLNAGFTTIRDLGSDPESVFAVRDAIKAGKFTGPTIIASGPSVGVTAGHGDGTENNDLDAKAKAGICDGADECRTLARHLQKAGADLIKIKITGGFSSNSGLRQHMNADEMSAIITAAHQRGIKVTAHAYEANAIAEAIVAGVDSIEHGYLLDEKTLKLMKANEVFFIPTLTVAQPPSMVKRFLRGREPISVTLRDANKAFETAYQLGVKIAFGTDCGIYPHGENADELAEMVRLGMSPVDAIRSATIVAAELFEIDNTTGTIEVGTTADIIAVLADPRTKIETLKEVPFVIKAGQVAKRDGEQQLSLDYSLEHKY